MNSALLANLTWQAIRFNPFTVEFTKPDGTLLPKQTVRIEFDKAVEATNSEAGFGSVRPLVILGVRDHANLPDTDIARGYRFWYLKREYTVIDVVVPVGAGKIEGRARAV